MSQTKEPKTERVIAFICSLCLDGAGGECHTSGCLLWVKQLPGDGIPIRDYCDTKSLAGIPDPQALVAVCREMQEALKAITEKGAYSGPQPALHEQAAKALTHAATVLPHAPQP